MLSQVSFKAPLTPASHLDTDHPRERSEPRGRPPRRSKETAMFIPYDEGLSSLITVMRDLNTLKSYDGSNYNISAAKTEAVEERNDVMLRLMGHLIPDSIVPEEVSPSETDTSIVSSASTLKHRLHNLPTPSEAVKLADRVAALNRRIRRERDLYLHLQGLTNRIEEKDEGDLSTTDSSKTVNSTSNRHQQGQNNNARARRRQRLYSDSAKLQHQMSSDLQLCSPGMSSPEPLTLKEIQEDLSQEMEKISSPIEDQYSFDNNPKINFMRDNTVAGLSNASITQEYEMADEIIRSCQNASQFSNASYTEQNFCPVVSDCDNSTAMIDVLAEVHAGLSNSDFTYINYFKDFNKLSSEAKDARVTTTTSSTASSTGADYPYVTRKRTPTKFGGYRPSSGFILRNLSSDSESDSTSEWIVHKRLPSQKYQRENRVDLETHDAEERGLQDSDFVSRNSCSNRNRVTEKMEILKDRLLSPVLSTDRRHFFEESNANQRIETGAELQTSRNTGRAPIPPNGKNRHLDDDSGNLIKQNNFCGGNAGHFHNAEFIEDSFTDSFDKEKNSHISGNLIYDTNNENSIIPVHHVTFPPKKIKDIRSPLPSNNQSLYVNSLRDTETFIFREDTNSPIHGPASVNLAMLKSSDETSRITSHLPVLASVKSLSESIENSEDLRNRSENHDYEYSISSQQIDNDPANENVHPKIPILEIESQNCSQSTSLPSEAREDETARSSLDVNALIQALSDVSLKQKNSTNCTNRSIMKLKSPLGYGNRFSGSSGPRSSEYTPALGGSRQSLTSLEVSETHSMKISKEELTALRQGTPLLKSYEHSARSATTTDKVFEDLSRPSHNIKKSLTARSIPPEDLPMGVDLFRETSFIPLVAKIDRTNLVCARHPLKIKSIGKLISPRKYQNTDNVREEIVNPLTSRTDVSQSSKISRNSFRSLKSVQPYAKVHKQKIDGSQPKMGSIGSPAPLSGRRVLEPLNLVPKIKPELLTSINRRKKTANDLSEIINSQSEADSERIITPIFRRNTSRRSPLSRTTRTDLPIPRIGQRRENPIVQSKCSTIHNTEVLNNRKAPGEPFDNTMIKLSTEQDNLQLIQNSNKSQKYSSMSSEKSSVTSSNVLHLRSERLSMSSGDYEGNISWSPSPRDEKLTENDNSYDSEDKLYDSQKPASVGHKKLSEAMDPQNMTSSNFAINSLTTSVRNCVHLNDLQDGREVTLPCGSAKCQEVYLRKKELFNRLPNEIGGSLTRNTAFGAYVTDNLHSTKERPSTIEDLRRNIQENNDRWIKNFKNDDESENSLPESANGKVSSTGSSLEYGKSQYRSMLSNQSKIPQKISLVDHVSSQSQLPVQKPVKITESLCSRNVLSGKIDPGKSKNECLSTLYGNIKQESEYNSETSQMDSQRSSLIHSGTNSHQNTHRSIAESTDSTSVLRFDETLNHEVSRRNFAIRITEPSEIVSCNFKEEEEVNFEKQNIKLCDIQVISSSTKEGIAQENNHEAPFSVHPSDATSDTDKCDRKELQLNTEMTSNGCDKENQLANELEEFKSSKNQTRCSDNGSGVCVKISSPNSAKSAKSHIVKEHHQDGMISSPVSIKSFSSMSKLNSSVDSKWGVTVVTGVNSVKKSQDRFPFTISESASRKTSKFKVVADVSLDQLIQDQNAHAKCNSSVLTQHPIISAKSGDQIKVSTDTVDSKTKIDSCEQSPIRQLTPFLEEFSNKISNVSPDNWDAQTPFIGTNYISYGCREEPRTLIPNVKEMVKKISAKLRYSKTKRCQDPEETEIKILYKNKNCRGDFGEGSSSAASSYQSQLLNTSEKLVPSLIRRSNDGSRASSGKEMKPKRSHQRISMSMHHSPPKGCDKNDLWIQEFDSDVEFDILNASSVAYCQMPNDLKPETMPRTSSPVNDRYSMFLARRKLPGIIKEADHNELSRMGSVLICDEDGDSDKVHCKKREDDADGLLMKVPEMVLKSPKTPANSSNDSINNFEIYTTDGNFEDSTPKSGCCCFKIYNFFIRSRKRSSKISRSIKG